MQKGEWADGMFLSEVKGHPTNKNIEIRAWLEGIAIEKNPEFYKRGKKLTYTKKPKRSKTTKLGSVSPTL
jgi:hypothetical protein